MTPAREGRRAAGRRSLSRGACDPTAVMTSNTRGELRAYGHRGVELHPRDDLVHTNVGPIDGLPTRSPARDPQTAAGKRASRSRLSRSRTVRAARRGKSLGDGPDRGRDMHWEVRSASVFDDLTRYQLAKTELPPRADTFLTSRAPLVMREGEPPVTHRTVCGRATAWIPSAFRSVARWNDMRAKITQTPFRARARQCPALSVHKAWCWAALN